MYDGLLLGLDCKCACWEAALGAGVMVAMVMVDTSGGRTSDLCGVVDDACEGGRRCG